ncbi:MAG: ParB/RepB/Spo0J family partition protein [Ruminococcus sp.]|nr:ParB/RepB/Spo0J family partition protein [Ruminococcus sp.]
MKFDEVSRTYSKRKENRSAIAEQILEHAKVVEGLLSVSIDTVDDYIDKDGEQPFSIDGEKVEALAKSIAENGQLEPLIVRESKDIPGHYQLLAGHHRKQALLATGADECNIRVIEVNDRQAYCIVCETNIRHSGPLPSQLCKIFKRYRKASKDSDEKLTAEQLAKMFGISREQMYRYIALDKLVRPIQDLVDSDLISSNSIKEIAVLSNDSQKVLADYVVFIGKKLSPGKCKKIIAFLRDDPSADTVDIVQFLENEARPKSSKTNYKKVTELSIAELSSFLYDNICSLKSADEIRAFLEKENV